MSSYGPTCMCDAYLRYDTSLGGPCHLATARLSDDIEGSMHILLLHFNGVVSWGESCLHVEQRESLLLLLLLVCPSLLADAYFSCLGQQSVLETWDSCLSGFSSLLFFDCTNHDTLRSARKSGKDLPVLSPVPNASRQMLSQVSECPAALPRRIESHLVGYSKRLFLYEMRKDKN